jgi:CRISPR-associated exonuclease Cas4
MILLLLFALLVALVLWVLASGRREAAYRKAGLPPDSVVTAADLETYGFLQGATLRDSEWGLAARPDIILLDADDAIPVEGKRLPTGRRLDAPWPSHRVQLGVHFMVCEADHYVRRRPREGWIRYFDDAGRIAQEFRVPNDEALKQEVLAAVSGIRKRLQGGEVHRSHENPGKCRGCSVRHACEEALA